MLEASTWFLIKADLHSSQHHFKKFSGGAKYLKFEMKKRRKSVAEAKV